MTKLDRSEWSDMQVASALDSAEIRHYSARVGDVRLHYVECGSANNDLVILLHGFPESAYAWRKQIPVLAERFRVVAPDLRGYAQSEKPPPA